ncbi:MAG: hypothetical protein JXJ22_15190 [Bacteroidales bacterium]|nr:hypothetical protein [Bacteroidales bacterium]
MRFKLFGSKGEFGYELKLILITSLIISSTSFVAIFINIFIGLESGIVILSAVSFIVYLLLYFFGRLYRNEIVIRWVITIVSLLTLNATWYLNNSSNGPINYLFLVFTAIIIVIWDKKKLVFLIIIVAINIALLFYIESYFPEIIKEYPNRMSRIIDIYTGLIISLIILASYTLSSKRNYLEQLVAAKQSDELKSAFLANMSHEVRTPLNAIVGLTRIMIDNDLTPDQKNTYSEIVHSNSVTLIGLIEDIMDMSKIESKQLTFNYDSVNIHALFDNLKEKFQKELISNVKPDISLEHFMYTEKFIVKTDAIRLEQILNHLLANAVKYTKQGAIHFGCSESNGILLFFVKDTGIGIKQKNTEKIFDRFIKIEEDKDNVHRGTGLGLYLSKKLVHLLKGNIWVETEYGVGSTFYFTLPDLNDKV